MSRHQITLAGVPEHFNLPIHLAIEAGDFKSRGLDINWQMCSGGTGQMCKALRDGEVDACVLLTEGIIKDIIAGNPSKIVSGYIKTPLIWGIHTGAENSLVHHQQIYDRQYAISRFGSGSHLMAIVDAASNDRSLQKDQFSVVRNLDGALKALKEGSTDVFYWEKYTTKPFVDSGELRRVGEFLTPWPCFVIAATDAILKKSPEAIVTMLEVIHERANHFMQSTGNINLVAERYQQRRKDAERWFHATEWSTHGWVSDKMLHSVVHNLKLAGIVDESDLIPELVWERN